MNSLTLSLVALLVSGGAFGGEPSPAEQRIALARRAIEKHPQQHQVYNALALALARRARETADSQYYLEAEAALEKSLQLSPDNFEGLKLRVWLLLGQHEFASALEQARTLNQKAPDDVLVYGFLTDAHAELGNYSEAEEAAQWMLDMRPGNVPGLTRAAYLRELFGDIDGAIELMNMAYQQTPGGEIEDRAWLLTQIAHLQVGTGKLESAEKILGLALELFPGYHYALAQMGRLRTAQARFADAVNAYRERYRRAPHPENLYDLAEALTRAGLTAEARPLYAQFEKEALKESGSWDNANRELVFYYADRAERPGEALRVAAQESERRRDVFTRHAYAWALHRNGQSERARAEMEGALSVGIREASFFYHAGAIAQAAGDREAAARYWRESLSLNPASEFAERAREALQALEGVPGGSVP